MKKEELDDEYSRTELQELPKHNKGLFYLIKNSSVTTIKSEQLEIRMERWYS